MFDTNNIRMPQIADAWGSMTDKRSEKGEVVFERFNHGWEAIRNSLKCVIIALMRHTEQSQKHSAWTTTQQNSTIPDSWRLQHHCHLIKLQVTGCPMQLQSNIQMAKCWEHVHSAMYMPPEQTGRCATVLSTLLGEKCKCDYPCPDHKRVKGTETHTFTVAAFI